MSRPRIRTVKPEMRQDERYARLSYPARELFNGLITMADDEGRFRAPASAILGHVFPYDDDAPKKLREWVTEIRNSSMVLFYVDDGLPYGAFRHWKRHQKINRPAPSLLPPPPDSTVITENTVNGHGGDTEFSMDEHGAFTDGARSHAQARVPIRSLVAGDSQLERQNVAHALCHFLAARIVRRDPKMALKVRPDSDAWVRDMLLLLDRDERDALDVRDGISWCQDSDFWAPNIMCPSKLRKQFPVLWGQMHRSDSGNGRQNASDLIRKLQQNEAS